MKSSISEQKQIAQAIESWHNSDEFTFQTSGSTGTPKKIIFSKEDVIASITQSQKAFNLTDQDTALLCLPMKYVAGQMMLYRALHLNMNLATAEPKIDLSQSYNSVVSFAAFIPPQIDHILSTDEGIEWLKNIRVVLIGGGPISAQQEAQLKPFQNEIYHTYGMTETLTHIAVRALSKGGNDHFRPLPNVTLSQSEDDALIINADHLNVTLQTNDIVELQKDQTFKILGRKDNVINSGGLKIHPEEIESAIKRYVDKELIIKGIIDDQLGQKVTLIVESENPIDPEWLHAAYAEIDKARRPKQVLYTSEFLRTDSGKIIR